MQTHLIHAAQTAPTVPDENQEVNDTHSYFVNIFQGDQVPYISVQPQSRSSLVRQPVRTPLGCPDLFDDDLINAVELFNPFADGD